MNINKNSEIEITYPANKVAETINIGRSTLNKYSRSLEEHNYIFYKDERGNRAYTEHDIVTLRHLKELLDKSVTYDDAISTVAGKYRRELKSGSEVSTEVAIPATQHEGHYSRDIQMLKKELKESFQQMAAALQASMLQIPDPIEERQKKITDFITQQRVVTKLEEEALSLWLNKPFNERFIKTGLFSKTEDISKRDHFIKNYVNQHLEERLKAEFDI